MKLLKKPSKPLSGNAGVIHIFLTAALPLLLYVLVRLEDFTLLAYGVVLLSKWRMFSVKMRHWPANIRVNAVDIFVGLSYVFFLEFTSQQIVQFVWVLLYSAWLLFLKPRSSPLMIGLQAMIAQTVTLIAVFLLWNDASDLVLVSSVWTVTYFSSRHFLGAFDESMARATAYVWAFFSASLTWLTAHWLLFYGSISQPALILTVIAYGLGALYYLQHMDKLKPALRHQFVGIMVAILMFILVFSDWSGDIL